MLVVVGHGPSIVGKALGSWLDRQTVVRLKNAPRPNAEDWGTRIDYQCASTPLWDRLAPEIWVLPNEKETGKYQDGDGVRVSDGRWWQYFWRFAPGYKMSTGLRALCCAVEFLNPDEIGLLGFDNLIHPQVKGLQKWHEAPFSRQQWHDYDAEHQAAMALGVKLRNLAE
jgi:hypothetical protein